MLEGLEEIKCAVERGEIKSFVWVGETEDHFAILYSMYKETKNPYLSHGLSVALNEIIRSSKVIEK